MVWRLGGKRGAPVQSCTFKSPPGRSSDGARKLAEAAEQLAESRGHAITRDEMYRAILGEKQTAKAGVPTLAEWVDEWLIDRERLNEVQADTLATYRQIMHRRILPQLGHVPLTQIDRDTIRDWTAWLISQTTRPRPGTPGRPLSAKTVHRAHAVLHQALGAAVEKGWLKANPAARPVGARKNATGLPKARRYQGMFLEMWELRAILDHCSPTMRDIAFILSRTGLRLGELLVLRSADIVLSGPRPRIVVQRALKRDGTIGEPKTEQSAREVTVDEDTVAVLKRLVAGRRRSDLLFPAPRGAVWCPNNLRQRHWLPAVAAAQRCTEHPPAEPPKAATGPRRKLRLDEVSTCDCPRRLVRTPRIHDLRHTHVSVLVASEWQPKEIQERVGHASFQITMDVYGHLWNHGDSDRLEAMRRTFAMADDE